jgi:hypothetical protein
LGVDIADGVGAEHEQRAAPHRVEDLLGLRHHIAFGAVRSDGFGEVGFRNAGDHRRGVEDADVDRLVILGGDFKRLETLEQVEAVQARHHHVEDRDVEVPPRG